MAWAARRGTAVAAVECLCRDWTVPLVAHRLTTVAAAGRVPFVSAGRVIERRAPSALATSVEDLLAKKWQRVPGHATRVLVDEDGSGFSQGALLAERLGYANACVLRGGMAAPSWATKPITILSRRAGPRTAGRGPSCA